MAGATLTTLGLYTILLLTGLFVGFAVPGLRGLLGPLGVLALSNALPCSVIALWTGWRLHTTQPIDTDEVAVDPRRYKVWRGAEVYRVPARALVLPLAQRRWSGPLRDGRTLTLSYRLDPDPRDVLELGQELERDELDLAGYVGGVLAGYAGGLLPDPAAVREVAQDALLPRGVILTGGEVDGERL
jgi:hypothetical protein